MSDRILAPILALCLVCCALGADAALTEAHSSYARDDLEIVARGSYQELSIEGCVNLGEVGTPALPVQVLRFVVPSDMRVSDVVLSDLEELELPGTFRVLPVQPEVPTGGEPVWADPDLSVYDHDAPYPAQRVRYLGEGYLGGYRVAAVAFYPLQYAPRSGRLTLASSFSIELELDGSEDQSLPRHRVTARSDDLYRGLVSRLVVNPDDVDLAGPRTPLTTDSELQGFLPRYTPSLEGSAVEYVIITSSEFESQFTSFAEWKTRQGIPAVVRTVSWINSEYPGGVDSAERVRMFIQDAYESWGAIYVLLAGDTDVVPARFAKSLYSGGDMIPADIYYSCLDGDWNGDGDSYFGEGFAGGDAPGDSADFYPDVFVGRAPVNTAVEVETFISKCHAYMEAPDPVFTARDLILAEVLFPYDWVEGYYSFDGASDVMEPMMDLFPDDIHLARLYANTAEFPDATNLNTVTALDSLQAGYNLTFHVGHANKDILRAGTGNYMSMSDISALSGGIDKSSFIWLLNCTAAAIDYDCIAERAILNPHGAGVGVFGSTRLEFPGTSKDYLWEWIDLLYNGSIYRAGEVCALSKAAFASPQISGSENSHRWTQLALLLMGDPALPLWTGRATPLSVSHPGYVTVGQSAIAVTVTDAGGPLEGALVCLLKDGDVYERAITGPDGVANLAITADSEGTLQVTVTAQDHTPSETIMSVAPAPGIHVHLAGFSVDDGPGTGSGNGNGSIESGESVELTVDVGNGGVVAVGGLIATLSTD
ncbi:MAG: hypothetical protein JXB46_08520, partial [Candidatus Eisenbacteria bacterium]|nr:hypothetical protein [Candidatus Eisenbacteria bacterium]